jgi:hypothetical protein
MKRFAGDVFWFLAIAYIIGEITIRCFNLTIDVPKTYFDRNHLIKYIPNQHGNYPGLHHQWVINSYGYFGYEPPSLDSLIVVIGDSFISNEVNPPECHQCQFLSLLDPAHNYFPAARSGASFIEMMEISKAADSLKPLQHLIFVHDDDFFESIVDIERNTSLVQVSVAQGEMYNAEIPWAGVKRAFFNIKFLYYLYKKVQKLKVPDSYDEQVRRRRSEPANWILVDELLAYVTGKYSIKEKILILRPGTSRKMIDLLAKHDFRYFVLDASRDAPWELDADHHWSCYGHERAAHQVSQLVQTLPLKTNSNSR